MPAFRDLTPLFRPRAIAVVGASPTGNRGQQVLANLRRFGFGGEVVAVNPRYDEVEGFRCVAKLTDAPEQTDLVVVAVSAQRAVDVVDQAGAIGARAAVVIASGFGEAGTDGQLRDELRAVLDRHDMVAVGPNCYGVLDAHTGLAAYSGSLVDPYERGGVALVLQSGALSHAITDSAVGRGLGLSALVTTGNEVSATLADYVAWLADDPRTTVIGIFLEGLRDPEAFVAACTRARAAGKPVVVLATGRSERGRSAALAHTGAIAGSGGALSGLLRSVGAVQVDDLDEFRESLLLFSSGPRPASDGLAMVSISGGGTGLMADLAERVGLTLPELSDHVRAGVQAVLPDFGSASNPLDATGAAAEDPSILSAVLTELASEPTVGAVGFAFNVGRGSLGQEQLYRQQAEVLAQFARTSGVPTVGLTMTAGPLDEGLCAPLREAGVPLLSGMRAGLVALAGWLRWSEPPLARPEVAVPARVIPGTGTVVGVLEAFAELGAAGVPTSAYELVTEPAAAAAAADRVGLPCVVKIESQDVLHKTDAGGVRVGLASTDEVTRAAEQVLADVRAAHPQAVLDGLLVQQMVTGPTVECLVGVVRDPQAGLVLSVAPGGVLVELLGEAASLPVPVSRAQVESLIDAGPLAKLLVGYRGQQPFDRGALVEAVVSFSRLAAAYGADLAAAEINPLLVRPRGQGVVAVDCLIVKEAR